MVVVGDTDNDDENGTALLCLPCVTLATDPPHWDESISELLVFWLPHYYKTAKAPPSLPTRAISQEVEAGPKAHS